MKRCVLLSAVSVMAVLLAGCIPGGGGGGSSSGEMGGQILNIAGLPDDEGFGGEVFTAEGYEEPLLEAPVDDTEIPHNPEPATIALLGGGLAAYALFLRRRKED